jgi:hypothetical protein
MSKMEKVQYPKERKEGKGNLETTHLITHYYHVCKQSLNSNGWANCQKKKKKEKKKKSLKRNILEG